MRADDVKLMLAETRDEPFTDDDWLFELKHDGFRLLAAREGTAGAPRLPPRRRRHARLPRDRARRAGLPYEDLVLDGEVVVLDERGRPSFQGLQKRVQLTRTDRPRARRARPAGDAVRVRPARVRGLRPARAAARRRASRRCGRCCRPRARCATRTTWRARRGVLRGGRASSASRASSPSAPTRPTSAGARRTGSSSRADRTRRLRGGRLHAAAGRAHRLRRAAPRRLRRASALVYVGRAGSGFGDQQLAEHAQAARRRCARPSCPARGPLPKGREHVWVEPELVCEVRYKEWTEEGLLRQPVFLRFREDKDAARVPLRGRRGRAARRRRSSSRRARGRAAGREVHFSNLDKVFWPAESTPRATSSSTTARSSPWLLPYLRDRPLVLTRYPDGIDGKSFYQKDAPDFVPAWIRTEFRVFERAHRARHRVLRRATTWRRSSTSRTSARSRCTSGRAASTTLQRPDWCILDLDPKGAPFAHVVELALLIKRLCDEVGLPALRQDERRVGPARADPAGRAGARTSSHARWRSCSRAGRRASARDIATIERAIRDRERQGLRRLPAERARPAPGVAVQRAPAARRAGVDAARLERGRPRRSTRRTSRSARCRRGSRRRSATPCCRCWS